MTRQDEPLSRTRRRFLLEAGAIAGAAGTGLPRGSEPAAATPASMRAAIRKIVGEAPLNRGKIKIDVPALIENGNAVPFTVSGESPKTQSDHQKAIHVVTEKNPQPNVISVQLGPRAGRPNVAARSRLPGTQRVVAVPQ